MWLLSAGRLSGEICKLIQPKVKVNLKAVDSVLDITNTIFQQGLDHFADVEGVLVLDSGTQSLVDWGWLAQIERLGVPIVYITRNEKLKPNIPTEAIPHFRFVYSDSGIGVNQIANELDYEMDKRTEVLAEKEEIGGIN